MRHISTYEFELLQKKLERIEQTLQSDTCDLMVQEHFSLSDIQQNRQELEQIFRAYIRQIAHLEDTINQYHNLHAQTADKLRSKFRILNKNLENNSLSRASLGLPPYKPGRIKV